MSGPGSGDLAALARAQERQLGQLHEVESEGSALQQLLETSCVLELSKLASAQLDLLTFVQSTVGVIGQFFPIEGCRLEVDADGVPAVHACFGSVTHDQSTDGLLCATLLAGDEPVGQLVTTPVPDVLGGAQFVDRLAAQVAGGLAAVIESERQRRSDGPDAAVRLADSINDWADEHNLQELVEALALLPNAVGAQLQVDGPVGGPLMAESGLVGTLSDRCEAVFDDITVRMELAWDRTPTDGERATLHEVWQALADAVDKAEANRREQERNERDPLTDVGNRRFGVRTLAATLRRASHRGEPVAVMLIDLDHLSRLNAELGTPVGDDVLRIVAGALTDATAGGWVARHDGDCFLVVLNGFDSLAARPEAERLCQVVTHACASVLPAGRRQTASVGLSVYPANAGFADALVREADRALAEAKRRGHDQVVLAQPSAGAPLT